MVSDCESEETFFKDDPPQKTPKVNRYADNNLLQELKKLGVCKKDTGRCLRSLFSSEVILQPPCLTSLLVGEV